MHFLSPDLEAYAELNTSPEPSYLQELTAETKDNVELPQMLSGHLQGRLLSMISKLMSPHLILEIGTFTGYSALCLAEGLSTKGKLHTIDINTRLAGMVDRYVRKAGYHDRIHQHLAPATEVIPTIGGIFDLVFIDADKPSYCNYFDLIIDRMRPGGLIIADNILWSGRVLSPESEMDSETKGLHAYAEKVKTDDRVENVLLPIRDGLMVSRRK